jgi:hypothetical protein
VQLVYSVLERLSLPKIEIDVPDGHYELLQKVSEKLGLSVKVLIEQELDGALCNADVWVQRAEMLL